MANLITDGFEWMLAGQADLTRMALLSANGWAWFTLGTVGTDQVADVGPGRFDYGQALGWNEPAAVMGLGVWGHTAPLYKTVSEARIGGGFKRDPQTGVGVSPGLGFFDGPNSNSQIWISFEKSGVIKVWAGFSNDSFNPSGVLLASSSAGAFTEGEWFHCEAYCKCASVGGIVEVRVNTVPVIQIVSADTDYTGSGTFDAGFFGVAQNGAQTGLVFFMDDIFVNDTTGSYNNSWGGNLRVKSQFMIANGATDNFTIGGSSPAASHWQSILNQALDDTKYEFSSNVGDIDLFTPDPNLNSPLVRSVQVRMALRQDDATQRAAQAVLRIGGTNYPSGVNAYVNQTYTFYCQRYEVNPATGVTFTGADVNGLQAGLKLAA